MLEYTVKVSPNGDKFWYLNGKRHREDGPAIECSNGQKYWWINGKQLTEAEHKASYFHLRRSLVVMVKR